MKTTVKKYLPFIITLVIGIIAGWIIFGGDTERIEDREVAHDHEEETIWTCSMHPQIRQEEPGLCPICGMELIPLTTDTEFQLAEDEIMLSEQALKLAQIETVVIGSQNSDKTISLPGQIATSEENTNVITARFPGRIERLAINVTGQEVKRGQLLASIYSPELITAQKELLEAAKIKEENPVLFEAAKSKLKLLDLSERQIQQVLERGEPIINFNIYAPTTGIVTEKKANEGDYVKEGTPLFRINNLSSVWAEFEAYPEDLAWINKGDIIKFTVPNVPGKTFEAPVTYIDPVIDPNTRTATVRATLSNSNGQLKPEMLIKGRIETTGSQEQLMVPKSAVLWTGKKSVVYIVKNFEEAPIFEYREIETGAESGSYYMILSGLESGERIVSNGVFKIDAAAQLQGKVSMMNKPKETVGQFQQFEDLPAEFEDTFINYVNEYLKLKDALVSSAPAHAASAAEKAHHLLMAVDNEKLPRAASDEWSKLSSEMMTPLNQLAKAKDIEVQREAFSKVSTALYHAMKSFSLTKDIKAYYQYCPMAFNDTGGFWISDEKQIKNPYFGEAMLGCGEVKEEL